MRRCCVNEREGEGETRFERTELVNNNLKTWPGRKEDVRPRNGTTTKLHCILLWSTTKGHC